MENKLVYGIHDKPVFSKLIVFAIQQLLAIMAATLVVPLIINSNTAELFAALEPFSCFCHCGRAHIINLNRIGKVTVDCSVSVTQIDKPVSR